MRYFLLTVLLFCAAPTLAQDGILQVFVSENRIEITVGDMYPLIATTYQPVEYRLPPGTYRIMAAKEGYSDLVQTAEIRSGELTSIRFNLAEARPQERQLQGGLGGVLPPRVGDIMVLSLPTDQPVFINGQQRMLRSPMEITGMQVGYYNVKIADCEVLAPVRENMATRIECIDGVVKISYPDTEMRMIQYGYRNTPAFIAEYETQNVIPNTIQENVSKSLRNSSPKRVRAASVRLRKGLEIGIGAGALTAVGDGESDTGIAMHGSLAYGLTERFTVGWYGTVGILSEKEADDDIAVASVGGLFGRMYFRAPEKLTRFYLSVGAGQGLYQVDMFGESVKATGVTGMFGLGVDRASTGVLGYFLELNYNVINFDKLTFAGRDIGTIDVNIDYIVLAGGLRFRF